MSTTCPDVGTLRARIDGEAPREVDAHVEDCPRCAAESARLREDAGVAAGALALLAPPEVPGTTGPAAGHETAGHEAAGHETAGHEAAGGSGAPSDLDARRQARAAGQRPAFARRAAAAAAVAVVTVAALGTPAGREAAASFLSQFRSERIQVVTIDAYGYGMSPLAALSSVGTVDADPHAGMVVGASSVAEAERRTGLSVARVPDGTVPEEFARHPGQVLYTDPADVRVSFDPERVAAWLDEHGSDLDVPAGIGETTLAVHLPAAVAQVFRGPNFEELVVGQSGLVTAETEGPLGLEELRDFLLELPGLPPEMVEQLRAIDDWRSTLPLPVPAAELDWRDTTVGGVPAVALHGTHGFGSALLWQRDGSVHGVGGLVDERTARRIAESLEQR